MRTLTIDGVNLLTTYGVWIAGDDVYNGATADVETVKVPGRNGDLIYSNKRYNNFSLSYRCAIPTDGANKIALLRAFLFSNIGYRKIVDSYHSGMYRMGRITGAMNPSGIGWNANALLFTITFDCKPQHFYDSGDVETEITTSGTSISNATLFDSLPIVRIYLPSTDPGTGHNIIATFANSGRIYNTRIDKTIYTDQAASARTFIDLDCEIKEASHYDNQNGIINMNKYIIGAFPVLHPGSTTVTFTYIDKIVVKPRWWTL